MFPLNGHILMRFEIRTISDLMIKRIESTLKCEALIKLAFVS